MHRARRSPARVAATAAALALVGSTLVGCAALPVVSDLAAGRSERVFDDRAEAEGNWSVAGVPSWIPADATDIHHRYTARRHDEILSYTSRTDPAECDTAARASDPTITAAWAPGRLADRVFRCGDWQVQRDGDAWFAWRADGTLQGAAPAAG
jgi:hypothetical protein